MFLEMEAGMRGWGRVSEVGGWGGKGKPEGGEISWNGNPKERPLWRADGAGPRD